MNWRYRHTALALCTLAFTATMVARLAISPLVPRITARFGVTNATVGLALSGMWLAYALAQFPSGVLGDRYGERTVILTAVGATAVASLLIAASPSIAVFILFTVALGAGAGLHYSVATTFLAKQFDDIGRAIGVHVAGGPIAGLAAPPLAALVGSRYGWRAGILLGVAVAVPVFALFAWRVRPTEPIRPDQPMRERFALAPLLELLSRPPILYTTALATMGAFSWQATASFLPTFLDVGSGLSTALSALLFSLYFLVHGGTQPVTGSLSDRFGRDVTAMGTMSAGIAGYGLLVATARFDLGLGPTVAAVCLVGVAMSWGAPVQSRFMDLLSDAERGAGFGLVRTAYMVLGASGSVVVGTVSDVAGWGVAFGLLAGVMTLGLVTLLANRALGLGY
ncbi:MULTISPECIES: nitrate/nitrite transporter [unclassified Halorubrum]|uniref:MFS transporter n=1 Tax=unclassified Halorubrum TaxID=2642239 RepID=UPI000B9976FC|nr:MULTISPECIES: MFS transporter [unclassified Halorubrum]OYR39468.1 MFS transporter [Halorubrum sp. Eb13]OYR52970.1 MFS transporter [Halorubrum sp. Ea1]